MEDFNAAVNRELVNQYEARVSVIERKLAILEALLDTSSSHAAAVRKAALLMEEENGKALVTVDHGR